MDSDTPVNDSEAIKIVINENASAIDWTNTIYIVNEKWIDITILGVNLDDGAAVKQAIAGVGLLAAIIKLL